MRNKPKWYPILLILGLIFLLASVVVGCVDVSPERVETESYLAKLEVIANDATDVSIKVSNLYETADQLESAEIVQECAIYGEEYDDLLARLVVLEYPEECSNLRKYTIDAITYSKQEVTEVGAAFATGDMEHLYEAESYFTQAQQSIALAEAEWDRLKGY
jgi:hypothetical protein